MDKENSTNKDSYLLTLIMCQADRGPSAFTLVNSLNPYNSSVWWKSNSTYFVEGKVEAQNSYEIGQDCKACWQRN